MQTKHQKGERETLGSLSQELLAKEPDTLDPIELQREIQGDSYEVELLEAVERGKKKYFTDFYVVALNQRFRIFSNVIRTYFIDRISCPTPDFDQAVYRVSKKDDTIEFLWVVPDKETAEMLRDNPIGVDEEYRELLGYVLDFYEGTLMNKTRKLNKEDEQTMVITNH